MPMEQFRLVAAPMRAWIRSAMAALSPGYVRALITGLDDLAAMEMLLAPDERKTLKPAKPKKPKKKLGAAAA